MAVTELPSTPQSPDLHTPLNFGDPSTLPFLRSLTDVGALTAHLHSCIAFQRSIDSHLDSLLSRRAELDRAASSLLRAAPPLLSLAAADASSLAASSASTAALASALSARVRHLDVAHSRAESALARADASLARSRALDAARKALELSNDLSAAATAVREFLDVDSQFPTDDDLRRDLLDLKKRLEALVRRRLNAAIDGRNHDEVLQHIRLFPLLGLPDEGVGSFVAYLKKVVAMRSRLDFEHLIEVISSNSAGERPDFVGCLTRLFKDVYLAVEENNAVLRELRGEDGIVTAIVELQEECDTRAAQMLRKYMEFRRLAALSSDIYSHSQNFLSAVAGPVQEGPDPREVERYLEEILSLTRLGDEYTEFMVTEVRGLREARAELVQQALKSLREGKFNKVVNEVTGYYVILEGFFMVENVRKAIRIDEPLDGTPMITSMVDDVFFVLQSCCHRAASTGNANSVTTVIGGATGLLSNDYQDALQQRLREPNLGSKLFLGGVGVQKTGAEIATALNNIEISAEYVLKLRHEIEELCSKMFQLPAHREKIMSCLSVLGEISASYKKILNAGLEQLRTSVTPRIRPVLDTVATVSYELDDAEYGENEVNDPWVQKLLLMVESNVAWLQPAMTANNYDSFVHLIIDFIVQRLEAIMLQKRFSQLGGLQLDKEVRSLINHFSEMSQRPVRDKFSRLSQMSTILNFERVSEIMDFWGDNSGHMTWLLTPSEVRRVLGLRVDFRREAIEALRL